MPETNARNIAAPMIWRLFLPGTVPAINDWRCKVGANFLMHDKKK
jgi:hypothetical protein